MPIEIRELHIKAVIGEPAAKTNSTEKTADVMSSKANDSSVGQEQIIEACVEKVLEVLKEKSER